MAILGGGFGGGILGYAAVAMAYGSEASSAHNIPSDNEGKSAVGEAEICSNSDKSGTCSNGGESENGERD